MLCRTEPVFQTLLGNSCFSASTTLFFSIRIFFPLVETGINRLSLSSSRLAVVCIQGGAIIEVYLMFESFLFSNASLRFMLSGSTVNQPLIFETIVSVYFFAVASCLTRSKLFSKHLNYNNARTWSIKKSEVVWHRILIVAFLDNTSFLAVVEVARVLADIIIRLRENHSSRLRLS